MSEIMQEKQYSIAIERSQCPTILMEMEYVLECKLYSKRSSQQ